MNPQTPQLDGTLSNQQVTPAAPTKAVKPRASVVPVSPVADEEEEEAPPAVEAEDTDAEDTARKERIKTFNERLAEIHSSGQTLVSAKDYCADKGDDCLSKVMIPVPAPAPAPSVEEEAEEDESAPADDDSAPADQDSTPSAQAPAAKKPGLFSKAMSAAKSSGLLSKVENAAAAAAKSAAKAAVGM
jgi:hypothetical protein